MPPAYSSAIASLYLSGKQILVKRASERVCNSRHSDAAVDHNRQDVHSLSVRMFRPSKRSGLSPPRVRAAKKIFVAVRVVVLRQIERFRSRILGDVAEGTINAHETSHLVDVWNPGVVPTYECLRGPSNGRGGELD